MRQYKSIFKEANFLSVIDLEIGKRYSMMGPEGFGAEIKVLEIKKNKKNKWDMVYLDSQNNQRTSINMNPWVSYQMFKEL